MDVTCDQLEVLLPEMMDGSVTKETEQAAAAHLATCDHCRLIVDGTSQVRTAAKEYGKLHLPEEVRERIRRQLANEEPDSDSSAGS